MNSQIAFAKCPEDCVSNSMRKSIGIRVPLGAARRRNLHASQNQRSAIHQPMSVVANSDAKHRVRCAWCFVLRSSYFCTGLFESSLVDRGVKDEVPSTKY